jgi:hypothetical protein
MNPRGQNQVICLSGLTKPSGSMYVRTSLLNGWDLYATGYLDAANLLVESVLETGRSRNPLCYPVAFLFRHYLEFRLKEIILQGRELLELTTRRSKIHGISLSSPQG